MPARRHPHHDALLVKLSALLDAELPEDEQNQLFDAMAQDEELLAAFEALAATKAAFASLPAADADALTASVMAAVDPDTVPASQEGALALTSRAMDGLPTPALDALLSTPGTAEAVVAFASSTELLRAGGVALSMSPDTAALLAPMTERVDASVAASDRAGVLLSAHADAALSAPEASELLGLWARADDASLSLPFTVPAWREALVVARDSAAFSSCAKRAGDAALQAIDAHTRIQSASHAQAARREPEARVSFFVGIWQSFTAARLPLAFAGAAAALFFAVRTPAPEVGADPAAGGERLAQVMLDVLAPEVLSDTPRPAALPLLADNEADVEALDASGTTMVFSTVQSNITVIWLSGDDDEGEEQGT